MSPQHGVRWVGGLGEGARQLQLLFLEEGAAPPSSVGADIPSPPESSGLMGWGSKVPSRARLSL